MPRWHLTRQMSNNHKIAPSFSSTPTKAHFANSGSTHKVPYRHRRHRFEDISLANSQTRRRIQLQRMVPNRALLLPFALVVVVGLLMYLIVWATINTPKKQILTQTEDLIRAVESASENGRSTTWTSEGVVLLVLVIVFALLLFLVFVIILLLSDPVDVSIYVA